MGPIDHIFMNITQYKLPQEHCDYSEKVFIDILNIWLHMHNFLANVAMFSIVETL